MAQDMSDIIWTINPSNDTFKKLLQKLRSYATEIATAANMRFDCTIKEDIPEERLTMQQRRNVYLICKEAINNAVKYSAGKNLLMNVGREDHSVRIQIQDDGQGFDKENHSAGNGLLNMQERANEIYARLQIRSQQGDGTLIELTVKL
jgi:signal transduction histidine kinase